MASEGYYCIDTCLCHLDGSTRVCLNGCTECDPKCTTISSEQMAAKGYAYYVNADGVTPVTPELVKFLQGFAITQRYFADGEGWVETTGFTYKDENGKTHVCTIDSNDASQWLYACAYYKEIK